MPTELTIRQLRYFRAAYEEGTIAGASERLGTSASAISSGIADLETVVGATLLLRIPRRRLALTAAGRTVIDDVDGLLHLADRIETSARTRVGRHVVRFGCFKPFSPHYAPRLLKAASTADPPIDVEMLEPPVGGLVEGLLSGAIDLALLYDHALPTSLQTEVISRHRPFIVLAEGHRLADRPRVALADLEAEPMVLLEDAPEPFFEPILEGLGLAPNVVRTTDNIETLRSMVASGMGWSLLTGRPRRGRSFEGLAFVGVEIAEQVDDVALVLAYPAVADLSGAARMFADVCHGLIGSGTSG
ncbi:LysR family transcriptional regulator [Ilumatobacter sp.]|uniref:LysR family transcriptional regulator n=1 Tax=Ilumatobacter sp. TaxID=1967498 RepID=UPI003C64F0F2